MKALRFLRVLPLALSLVASPVMASQATIVGPVTGPHTMADVMGTINAAFLAIQGCNSGSSAPANGPSAAPVSFEMWCDTTTNPVVVKMYDGASWVVVGKLNTSSHIWTPEYQGTDLGNASIATTGTSGHVVPFLDGINTISALQTFNPNDFAIAGATSGSLKQNCASVCGTSVITWPSGTTNFSSTGGASNVLRQSSAGAPITVGQIGASDLTIGTFTAGSIPFAGGSAISQDNANLFWDATNKMFGVGTNTPFADNLAPGGAFRNDNNGFTRLGTINRSTGNSAVADINVSLGAGTGANYSNRIAYVGTPLTITGSANNGSGLIRLAVTSATLATGNTYPVTGVVGTTEANGLWVITVIDSSHVDLQGSAFVHTYVSGGTVGGSPTAISSVDTAVATLVHGAPLHQWEDTTLATLFASLDGTSFRAAGYLSGSAGNVLLGSELQVIGGGSATKATLSSSTSAYRLVGLTAGALLSDASGNISVVTTTGTGNAVRATSPTLVTPVLGAATATTINGAAIDNLAWTNYTPTITAAGGTFTTVVGAGQFKIVGKTMLINVDVTVTTVGTATSFIKATLPGGVTLTGTQSMGYSDSNVLFGSAQANAALPAIILAPSTGSIGNNVYHASGSVQIN